MRWVLVRFQVSLADDSFLYKVVADGPNVGEACAARRGNMLGIVHLGHAGQCPRAIRLRQELEPRYQVQLVCEGEGAVRVEAKRSSLFGKMWNLLLLLCGRFDAYMAGKYRLQGELPAFNQGLVCHDLLLLPLLIDGCGRSNVVFDAREYYPRQFEQSWLWRLTSGRLNRYLCTQYLPRTQACVTVSAAIGDEYQRSFGVSMRVVHSYATYHELQPSKTHGAIKLVHHGNASPNRDLLNMVAMMDLLGSDYQLDLYLVPKEPAYYARIVAEVAARPNVALHEPEPFEDLIETLNGYDIGLFVPPATTFNLEHALPNKLFEYLQARLMVVVSPLATAAEFVCRWQLGESSEAATPQALADCIAAISLEQLQRCKDRAHELAPQMNSATFAQAFEDLLQA